MLTVEQLEGRCVASARMSMADSLGLVVRQVSFQPDAIQVVISGRDHRAFLETFSHASGAMLGMRPVRFDYRLPAGEDWTARLGPERSRDPHVWAEMLFRDGTMLELRWLPALHRTGALGGRRSP